MTCTWEPDTACLGDKWDAYEPEVQQRALMLATSSLQMLTLYRVGTCPITIRPCSEPLPCSNWDPYRVPNADATSWLNGGRWLNTCGCRTAHWCAPLSEVDLEGPVGYIDSLVVDGEEIDLTTGNFRLDDGHLLVWQGAGPSPIPRTQDLNKDLTQPGTWAITYSKSYPVAADGRLAVAYLAEEFAKACAPKGACKLPRGVTSVVRNGVSFSIEAGLFPNGLTGIDIVDQFILKWVPPGSPQRSATVFVPGAPKARRTNALPVRSAGTPTP